MCRLCGCRESRQKNKEKSKMRNDKIKSKNPFRAFTRATPSRPKDASKKKNLTEGSPRDKFLQPG